MSENRIIALGSDSALKIEALRTAIAELELPFVVKAIKTSSGENEQPLGAEETFCGAWARAQAALNECPEAVAGVGIESGIFKIANGPILDYAYIVILRRFNVAIITTTPAVVFPESYVAIAEERGFKTTTVGSVLAEKSGDKADDPHSTVTGGKISRLKTLIVGLEIALCQI